jgi:hypothetical protein
VEKPADPVPAIVVMIWAEEIKGRQRQTARQQKRKEKLIFSVFKVSRGCRRPGFYRKGPAGI